ncbi:hypothetical protein C4F40_10865 [Sphingobacterium sp. Ka21]|uniref:Uncharacterized protein n=1 Tax=Sphingobacterium pedocola TaxID=2082722 RepID=A0ABR9T8L0_9SPHI|nr:hypothetical protein [Sphingobacterium pedocola]
MVNHLDSLAEDRDMVLKNALLKAKTMDFNKLKYAVREYGHKKTKKLIEPVLDQMKPEASVN